MDCGRHPGADGTCDTQVALKLSAVSCQHQLIGIGSVSQSEIGFWVVAVKTKNRLPIAIAIPIPIAIQRVLVTTISNSTYRRAVPLMRRSSSRNAVLVGSGIFLSRIIGLVRERIFAHYFGNSDAADAFKAALKIPNLLQNLFGEGALSSSFIPVYANLLASGNKEEANRVARVIGSMLVLAMSLLVLAGVLATPLLIDLIAPGFKGVKRDSTIQMVRIMFPGVGVLVLSAWCLGILNSHRRFFLPYAAPVLWNVAMIAALVGFGGRIQAYPLAKTVAWGSVAGSLLQFGVQLPSVLRLAGRIRFQIDIVSVHIRTVIRNFIPGVASRGVNQLSSYIDLLLAGFLPTGAVAKLSYAQTIYLIPVSLFGMSISNAELPEMASQTGSDDTIAEELCRRLNRAMQRVAFFIIPSVAAFLVLGRQHRCTSVPDGQIYQGRRSFCLGGAGRIHNRTPRVRIRPPIHIRVLGVARHPHATSLREFASRANGKPRMVSSLPRTKVAWAVRRHRPYWVDRLGRHRGMDRIHAFAIFDEPPDRHNGFAGILCGEALDHRNRRRCGGVCR